MCTSTKQTPHLSLSPCSSVLCEHLLLNSLVFAVLFGGLWHWILISLPSMNSLSILLQRWKYHYLCVWSQVNLSVGFGEELGLIPDWTSTDLRGILISSSIGSSGLLVVRIMIGLDSPVWIDPEMCWSFALLMEPGKKKQKTSLDLCERHCVASFIQHNALSVLCAVFHI